VRTARTILVAACLAVPAAGYSQTAAVPELPVDTAPPLRLFKDRDPPSSGGWIGSIKSIDLWKPPASGSEVPRWIFGRSVEIKGPGRLAFSGGLYGRRGDPLPLYLSQDANFNVAGSALTGPGSYQQQWDTTFRVSATLLTRRRVTVKVFGELFVPLTRWDHPADPAPSVLSSHALRFGLVTIF
jgi:hypothetical protein